MGEAQEVQLQVMGKEAKEASPPRHENETNQPAIPQKRNSKWWLLVAFYSLLLLAGQSVAVLLGRLYFEKGGNSSWMGALVQPAGFPILLPFYLSQPKSPSTSNFETNLPSNLVLASIYISSGLFLAIVSMLHSLGLKYLPVSTYSLVCASQLGFNALFSFFLNSLKLTPFIINSLVLLTISSILLVFQDDSAESKQVYKRKYAFGFICTVGASAGYGLLLSLTQFAFKNVLKQETFKVVLDMTIYPSLACTIAVLVGLFASGEWKGLGKEMEGFKLGEVSYCMTLIWTAISWQLFSIGCVGLIFEVSSVFSNVISTFGLPVVPVLAVFCFGDKMDVIKAIAMVLAIWGFLSYVYQHYLDDCKLKKQKSNAAATEMLITG